MMNKDLPGHMFQSRVESGMWGVQYCMRAHALLVHLHTCYFLQPHERKHAHTLKK
jgi:hypothetical protein